MDWRILAAAVAALGVLGGGTLLATQVQGDLEQGVETRIRDTGFERPSDTPPLKLNDFKLPKDVPFDIPPGTEISPDLSELTLPRDLDLQLPDDLDLSGLDFELPEDFKLELPPGTEFSPPGLKLPDGATIKLPDGRTFKIPPGSNLDLPPEVVQRLLAQGLPAGQLGAPRDFDLSDLPPDLVAKLDPPRFDGAGTMRLPAGTTITLPDGQKLPFAPGALAYAARYLLPAGTTFDIPFDAETSPGGTMPVPQPRSRTQLVDDSKPASKVAVTTEITTMPNRVRKGDPVTVSGFVRESLTGRAVAGAPVDVFMNETKRSPGVLVGQGVTDASGIFTIRLELPTDKPAREYQLVNHAVAFTNAAGRVFADGWGDPPFSTFAGTSLTLELPARDGLGSATSIGGTLKDNAGAAVAGVAVTVSVDGAVVGRPLTDANGRFAHVHTFTAGQHVVEARFAGSQNYDPSNVARGSITIDDFAIEIAPILRAKPGDGLVLNGRVLGKGAVAPEREVVISNVFGAAPIRLVSDSAGRFTYSFATSATQAPGQYVLHYSLPEFRVNKTQIVELNLTGRISMSPPSSWDVELPIPVALALESSRGAPIAGQQIRLMLAGPGGSSEITIVTDSAGRATPEVKPLRPSAGLYTLTARVVNAPHLEVPPSSASVTLGLFEVEWAVPSKVVRDQDMSGSVMVRFAGRPLASQALTLDVFGPVALTTGPDGKASWSKRVPPSAALGQADLTLKVPDHPTRTTTTSVVAIPKITLDVQDVLSAGASVEASVVLTDDRGAPIRNTQIAVTTVSEDAVGRTVVQTDSAGRWRGPLNLSASGGNVTVSARLDPTGPYLGAEDVQTMAVKAPVFVERSPLLWIIPLTVVAAAGAGAGVWALLRKRGPPRPRATAAAAAAPAAPALRPSDVELTFAIPTGEPPVWGVGDPLRLTARNHAEAGAIELRWPGGRSTLQLAEEGAVSAELTFPEEGEVTIEAVRPGHEPSVANVRIVDYRKETAREFDLFLEKARNLDPSLTRKSTPREIAWTLAGRLEGDAERQLEEIALVMEVTNYSHYAVSREHYLRFVRAARALDAFFAPRATAPGGG